MAIFNSYVSHYQGVLGSSSQLTAASYFFRGFLQVNHQPGLSALGNVINALVEIANGKNTFVPFRNSKLTRVIQESLGGNSLCTMLATLSPAASNYEETMSTLRYANRAKAIKVSATKNLGISGYSRITHSP